MPSLIPSTWTRSHNPGAGVRASIVLPGIPGIQHVLDSINARFLNNQSGANVATLRVLDGATQIWTWSFFGSTNAAGVLSSDDLGVTVSLAGTPGQSMTVDFAFAFAGYLETISIVGHDA